MVFDYENEQGKQVRSIIETADDNRIGWVGGYPSEWEIRMVDGEWHVLWATLSSSKEYRMPELVVQKLDDFLKEHDEDTSD